VARSFEAELPRGVDWPTELPRDVIETAAEGPVTIEPSFLETTAAFHWLCAWEGELVDAVRSADVDRARVATERVAGFVDLNWYSEQYLDPDGVWFATVAEPALRGDLRPVEQELRNCESSAE
jgi:hypothetical protein